MLVEFAYTGKVELSLMEVRGLLVAANQLKFPTVVRVSKYMYL